MARGRDRVNRPGEHFGNLCSCRPYAWRQSGRRRRRRGDLPALRHGRGDIVRARPSRDRRDGRAHPVGARAGALAGVCRRRRPFAGLRLRFAAPRARGLPLVGRRGGVHQRGAPPARRGRALYETLFSLLRLQGFYVAHAGITLPNAASVGLHEALGFQPVGVYPAVGWKFGAWRDVGWWRLPLQPLPDPRPAAVARRGPVPPRLAGRAALVGLARRRTALTASDSHIGDGAW